MNTYSFVGAVALALHAHAPPSVSRQVPSSGAARPLKVPELSGPKPTLSRVAKARALAVAPQELGTTVHLDATHLRRGAASMQFRCPGLVSADVVTVPGAPDDVCGGRRPSVEVAFKARAQSRYLVDCSVWTAMWGELPADARLRMFLVDGQGKRSRVNELAYTSNPTYVFTATTSGPVQVGLDGDIAFMFEGCDITPL